MALTGQALIDYITQRSQALGLDPRAVLAVATVEGGFSGAVGDSGTSFGPFQLHIGGALPSGKGKAWAQSTEGVDYALAQIAKVAKGKSGLAAITAIVTLFERPAAPQAEISRAMKVYGTTNVKRSDPSGKNFAGNEEGGSLAPDPGLLDSLNPLSGFSALLKAETWIRVAEGVVGILALVGAVILLAQATGVTAPVEKTVGTVVGVVGPGGKVGKAVQLAQAAKGGAQ